MHPLAPPPTPVPAVSALHAHVPEETLVRALEFLQAAGLGSLSKPWQLQMAFRCGWWVGGGVVGGGVIGRWWWAGGWWAAG